MDVLEQVIEKLKEKYPSFVVREQQIEMMQAVYEAMHTGKKAAVHAPTGTGKSLGYLIPYIAMKLNDPHFKITISTFTISLQEQLKKEIGLINAIYNDLKEEDLPEITYSVLIGKANYLCERRLEHASKTIPFDIVDEVDSKVRLLKTNEEVLDKQKINVKMSHTQWGQMNVENCKKEECPLHATCDYFNAYFGETSDIAIVNHSLYFNRHFYVDEAWDRYAFNIFDESHKIEKVLLGSSTVELSEQTITNWLSQAVNIGFRFGLDQEKINDWTDQYFRENRTVQAFKKGGLRLAEMIDQKKGKYKNRSTTVSYEEMGLKKENFAQMIGALEKWQRAMFASFKELAGYETAKDEAKKNSETMGENKNAPIALKTEIDYWGMNLSELREFYNVLRREETVLWIEKSKEKVYYKITPSTIRSIPRVFEKGLLMTSGTLAEKGSCKSFGKRLNVVFDIDKVLSTPFELKERTLIHVAKDISPKRPDYMRLLKDEIHTLLELGEKKTFILFTSTEAMSDLFTSMKSRIESCAEEKGEVVEVWLQSETNHKEVMDSFKNRNVRSVLFGTLTYFEGIDLKGDQLTQVILTRLPFAVPDHPIQRILDSEYDFSHWETAVRIEQAFGRLIRSETDYGTFSILDNRIIRYKEFLRPFRKEGVRITAKRSDVKTFYELQKDTR